MSLELFSKVTIGIPTYKRERYLDYLLDRLAQEPAARFFQVVVSDDDKTRGAEAVVRKHETRLHVRYLCNPGPGSFEHNLDHCRRACATEYFIYMSDDDYLDFERLPVNLKWLEENPEVVAIYVPHRIYDLTTGQTLGQMWHLEKPLLIQRGKIKKAAELALEHDLLTEHGIIRQRAIGQIPLGTPKDITYWGWQDLATLLLQGHVIIDNQSFYLWGTRHPLDEGDRGNDGHAKSKFHFDNFTKGGFDYLLAAIRRVEPLLPHELALLKAKFDKLLLGRMRIAIKLLMGSRDYLNAYRVALRVFGSYGIHAFDKETRRDLLLLALLDQHCERTGWERLTPASDWPEGALEVVRERYAHRLEAEGEQVLHWFEVLDAAESLLASAEELTWEAAR